MNLNMTSLPSAFFRSGCLVTVAKATPLTAPLAKSFSSSSHNHGSNCHHNHIHGAHCQHNHNSDINSLNKKQLHTKIMDYLDEFEIDGTSAELQDLLDKNEAWVSRKKTDDPNLFRRMAAGQSPKYLYIGCSDARVDPKEIMGLENDEVFVTRNIGNQVGAGDMNVLSVIEFAVEHLKVPHIIVCGHYECGAVKGAMARPKEGGLGLLENWLRNIRDVARIHAKELNAIADADEKHKRLVEWNVVEQCFNVLKTGSVQRRRAQTFSDASQRYCLPRVHGVIFDVSDGRLKKVPLPFKESLKEFRPIYDLYQINHDQVPEDIQPEFWEAKKNINVKK